jgi:hypothetical protein
MKQGKSIRRWYGNEVGDEIGTTAGKPGICVNNGGR